MTISLHPTHAVGRVLAALLLGGLAALLLSRRFSPTVALLGGWDMGGLTIIALAWIVIASADAGLTRRRAGSDDPGRTVVYALVLLASSLSLVAANVLVHRAKDANRHESTALVALCLCTVALSWALTHTAFALRYAHLYYRADSEGLGGVEFR